jgi:hypothetical protein
VADLHGDFRHTWHRPICLLQDDRAGTIGINSEYYYASRAVCPGVLCYTNFTTANGYLYLSPHRNIVERPTNGCKTCRTTPITHLINHRLVFGESFFQITGLGVSCPLENSEQHIYPYPFTYNTLPVTGC